MQTDPELIVWLDSIGHNSGGWGRLSAFRESITSAGLRHESVGFVIAEDDHSVTFCGSRGIEPLDDAGDVNVCDVMQIPAAAIVSRTKLVPAKR